jgi:hypothetical protein
LSFGAVHAKSVIFRQPNFEMVALLRNPPQNHSILRNSLTELASMACSRRMEQRPKLEWFQAQALQCIGLALRAKDPRIKRLYTLEAERWLHLAELKGDHDFRDYRTPYYGVERRKSSRHLARAAAGVILLESDVLVECAVRTNPPTETPLPLIFQR